MLDHFRQSQSGKKGGGSDARACGRSKESGRQDGCVGQASLRAAQPFSSGIKCILADPGASGKVPHKNEHGNARKMIGMGESKKSRAQNGKSCSRAPNYNNPDCANEPQS